MFFAGQPSALWRPVLQASCQKAAAQRPGPKGRNNYTRSHRGRGTRLLVVVLPTSLLSGACLRCRSEPAVCLRAFADYKGKFIPMQEAAFYQMSTTTALLLLVGFYGATSLLTLKI